MSGSQQPITSTYRVQLRRAFGFDDCAAIVPYLADLGITHLYCSPWLQAAPRSAHGYDVVDHTRVNDDLGGSAAWERLVAACHKADLGIVLDIVPNHMAVSEPQSQNAAWWSVLRDGRESEYASWFDIDWNSGPVMVPVLGGPLAEVVNELKLDGDRIRYYDHEVPVAPGTLVEGDLLATLARQHYRLCHWRVAADELNIRRFFDVTSLAGVRVEEPAVFDATHALVLEQVRSGAVQGLRIDHPDGLADPQGYLERLAAKTDGAWVVVEKILEPGESLPAQWRTAGTTGYDALNRVLGLFVDPAGAKPLTDLWTTYAVSTSTYQDVVEDSKQHVLDSVLNAELRRLVDIAHDALSAQHLDVTHRALREALIEILSAFDVYRAYVPAHGPADDLARDQVHHAASIARDAVPDRAREVTLLERLALADDPSSPEFVVRFQQTCGPVMAKGVEDTAFYRYLRLSALNEVGGDPSRFGLPLAEFHRQCEAAQRDWPLSQTTLSTHDTKRSEDVRARIALLSHIPGEWAAAVQRWSRMRGGRIDGATEMLVWQTLVGAWPLTVERAVAYIEKATREAKVRTSWVDPDPDYDESVADFVRTVLADADLGREIDAFVERLRPAWEMTVLSQKLVQLMLPGVADTYQGTELEDLSLVDPDNRRPVDYGKRRRMLADLPAAPAKLRLTAAALRLRKEHPQWFLADATYVPLNAGKRAVAFSRSDQVVVVAPIRPLAVEHDGWGGDSLTLPTGRWRDVLTGSDHAGNVALDDLLDPVALLVRA